MENQNISNRPSQSAPSVQQNQEVKPKLASPSSLLRSITGAAKRTTGELADRMEGTVRKMNSALQTGAKMAGELDIPELPQARTPREVLTEQAPNKTLSGEKFDPNADASALMQAGRGDVFGTKEKQIRELLADRTPEQLKAIEAVYNHRFEGREMWKDLKNEFGKGSSDRKMIEAFEKGDRVGAVAEILVGATTGTLTNKTRVRETLEKLSPEERQQVQERYTQLHPKNKDLREWVDDKFSSRKQQVNDLLDGDDQAAKISDLQRSLGRNKGAEVVTTLRGMGPEQRRDFIERFDSQAAEGEKLADLVSDLKGTNGDQARALVAGNQAAADAALIQDSVDGMGSNKNKLWEGLGAGIEDPAERQAYMRKVESEYNRMYGPESRRGGKALQDRLKSELGGENEDKALTMLQQGEVPPEKQILYSVSGSRKDGQELADLVKQYGPEEARRMYAQATVDTKHPEGRVLDDDIQSRLSGRGRFEAEMAMRGEPKDPEQAVAWARERAEFESKRGRDFTGAFTITDDHMWNNVDRAENALQDLRKARESGDPQKVAAAEASIRELTGYAKADTELYRDAKDAAVETAAGVAAGVGAGVAIAVTGGAAAPLVAAGYMSAAAATTVGIAAGAATGAALNYGVRRGLSGNAYNDANTGRDLAVGAMEGFGVKGGSLVGGALRRKVAKSLGEGVVGKTVGATVEGASDGLVGGGLMGATETAVADGTWDRGFHGFTDVAKGARDGAVGGAVMGGALGRPMELGMDAAGAGLRKAGNLKKAESGAPVSEAPGPVDVDAAAVPQNAAALPDLKNNPLIRLMNRLRKAPVEKLPRDAWKTDVYRSAPEYRSLTKEQRADYDALIETVQKSGSDRQDLTGLAVLRLLESGRLVNKDKFGRTTLDNLTSLRTTPRSPELAREAQEILQSSIRLVGDPGHAPHQGSRGTCAVVGLQHLHAKYAPADFIRVVDGLTGKDLKTTWASGAELKTNSSSLKTLGWDNEAGLALEQPGFDFRDSGGFGFEARRQHHIDTIREANRGPVSRIYQSAAMDNTAKLRAQLRGFGENVRAEYDNNLMKVKRFDTKTGASFTVEVTPENRHLFNDKQLREAEGNRGGFRYRNKDTGELMKPGDLPRYPGGGDGTFVADGTPDKVTEQLLTDIFDRKAFAHPISRQGRAAIDKKGVANLEPGDLTEQDQRTLRRLVVSAVQAQRKGRAIALTVKWGTEGHSYHSVSLVGMSEDGRFLIKNSQTDGLDNIGEGALGRSEVFAGNSVDHRRDKIFAVSPENLLTNFEGFVVSHFTPGKEVR